MSRWKRVMAVGCSHGDLIHPTVRQQVLEFKKKFNPDIRFDLGDLIDTACFRTGAAGSKDEFRRPDDDETAALGWLSEYEPTHITFGNHDDRLLQLSTHPKAIISSLAGSIWNRIQNKAKQLKAQTVNYNIRTGWIIKGGMAWGHGYMVNMQSVRDHAEMMGMPVCMAHLHTPQQVTGRTYKDTESFCVGALADERKLEYGHRNRNSLAHTSGIVYGEMNDKETHLWLIRANTDQEFHFPPNL